MTYPHREGRRSPGGQRGRPKWQPPSVGGVNVRRGAVGGVLVVGDSVGGAVTPRASADDAAKCCGSKRLFPSTSSAEPPSDTASSMLAVRSAAISLAMGFLARRAGATHYDTPRRTCSRSHLHLDQTKSTVDRVTCRSPFPDALLKRSLALRRHAVVLAWWATIAGRTLRLDKIVTLEPSEERIDRPLSNDRETTRTQSLRHLVAVRRTFGHYGQETKVENASKQLATPSLRMSHAPQGTRSHFAFQGIDRRRSNATLAVPPELSHRGPFLTPATLASTEATRSIRSADVPLSGVVPGVHHRRRPPGDLRLNQQAQPRRTTQWPLRILT